MLNSNELRIALYLAAAVACALAGTRERRSPRLRHLDLWPTFWFLSAGLVAVMGAARSGDVIEWATSLLRAEARSAGWYESRRVYQGALVAFLAAGWFVAVVIAIWRVPERRRRYLPEAIAVSSLVCFAGIRLISFHYVDAVLYNHPLFGVRIASMIELMLTSSSLGAALWRVAYPERLVHRPRARGPQPAVGQPPPNV